MYEHFAIGKAASIPVSTSTPVVSISPVVLTSPNRMVDLQMRISAPTTGENLPVILLSHGLGHSNYLSSQYGYGPIVNFWSSHGFIVIQPTHLDSGMLGLDPLAPEMPPFWKSRVDDMAQILDQYKDIEKAVPEIAGRIDWDKVAVVGHSMGGLTAGMLLGEQLYISDNDVINMSDSRIKTGVLLAAPGDNDAMTPAALERLPFYNPDYSKMTRPALIVYGDGDGKSPWTTRKADWHSDPYYLSPSPKSLLTIANGTHSLGGISGYDAAEADDENVERAAIVGRLTWAYLRSALFSDDTAWSTACDVFSEMNELVHIENK